MVLHAAAQLVRDDPELASQLTLVFVGGPSGTGRADPDGLTELARSLGIADLVRLEPPCPQAELADWYRAATVVMVPSHSESFGLVAVEAQACGTPVDRRRGGRAAHRGQARRVRHAGGRPRSGQLRAGAA